MVTQSSLGGCPNLALEPQLLPPVLVPAPNLPSPLLEVMDLSSCLVSKPTVQVRGWGVSVVLKGTLPMLVRVAFAMVQESKPFILGQLITLQPTSWALAWLRRGRRMTPIARNDDCDILELDLGDTQSLPNSKRK